MSLFCHQSVAPVGPIIHRRDKNTLLKFYHWFPYDLKLANCDKCACTNGHHLVWLSTLVIMVSYLAIVFAVTPSYSFKDTVQLKTSLQKSKVWGIPFSSLTLIDITTWLIFQILALVYTWQQCTMETTKHKQILFLPIWELTHCFEPATTTKW